MPEYERFMQTVNEKGWRPALKEANAPFEGLIRNGRGGRIASRSSEAWRNIARPSLVKGAPPSPPHLRAARLEAGELGGIGGNWGSYLQPQQKSHNW